MFQKKPNIHDLVCLSYGLFSYNFFFSPPAWVQVSSANVPVTAVFKTSGGFIHAGSVVGESNCWSMLKGGLTVDQSGPAHLYFEVLLKTEFSKTVPQIDIFIYLLSFFNVYNLDF